MNTRISHSCQSRKPEGSVFQARHSALGWLLILLCLAPLQAWSEVDGERLAEFTERGMEMWSVPGMAVAVASRNEVAFQQGFGTTSIDDGKPVDEHTLFAIASTTKAMVVAGLLILQDEEKLSLDEPVTRYVPELDFSNPMLNKELMLSDLLAHRTGLPSTDLWTFFMNMPLEEQIGRLATVELASPVRTRLIYQNTMFELAGLVIERVSGEPWDKFLKKRLWKPIGMHETYGARGQIPRRHTHVMPHDLVDDNVQIVPWDLPADLADAAGSAWSSVHDMTLWAQFLLRGGVTADGDRLISEESMEQMFEPLQLASTSDFYPTAELTQPNWRSYGLGWFQQDFQGRKIDFHTGSLSGLIAIIGLDHANDKAVIVLGNRDHAEMRHAILWDVMDHSPVQGRRDWNQDVFDLYASNTQESEDRWSEVLSKRLENTSPSLPVSSYAGTYSSAQNGDISIAENEGALQVETPLITMGMEHWHIDTFLVTHDPWSLKEFAVFQISAEGQVTGVEVLGQTYIRLNP